MEWQPIETAPKDGTWFLATEGFKAFYACSLYYEDEDGPVFSAHCGQPVVQPPDPTHWMPLPETPAA